MDVEGVGRISEFNEASLKMLRIDNSQKIINDCWINPLGFNYEKNVYNYIIISVELFNLLSEVYGKLSNKEKEIATEKRTALLNLLNNKPIFTIKKGYNYSGKVNVKAVLNYNWEMLKEELYNFQNYLKELYEVHELSTPNKEADEGWD